MKKFFMLTVSRNSLLFYLITIPILISSFILFFFILPGSAGFATANTESPDDSQPAEVGGKLAIIIDDFGSGRDGVDEMMSIKEHITFAVMPFLDNTLEDAELAHGNRYEVIVHLPMEANSGKRSWLGPHPILAGMEADEVRQIVRDSFDSVPYAAGANIHMGSSASNDEDIMSAVLDVIKEKGLYFVDSRTADRPKAKKVSMKKGVVCYERDVFLDGQQPGSFIIDRLKKAEEIALKKGQAVAAGHVGMEGGKVTADAINQMLPEFKKKNIKLVYVSELNEGIVLEQN